MYDIALKPPSPPQTPPPETPPPKTRPTVRAPQRILRRAGILTRTARTIFALMLREIATSYGRSPGGYLWALADPVLGIALLTLVFQGALGTSTPLIGTNFPMFYATGYLPFIMYHDLSSKVAMSLRFSRPLLDYPAVTFIDALIARWLLNAVTHFVVFVIVIGSIVMIYDLALVADVATVLQALVLTALLGLGVGTLNCFLMMRFSVWERAWSILSRPLMLMSGVFYTYSLLPIAAQQVLWWNPILHVVGLLRRGIYGVYAADYVSSAYVLAFSLITLVLGLLLIWRRYHDLLEIH